MMWVWRRYEREACGVTESILCRRSETENQTATTHWISAFIISFICLCICSNLNVVFNGNIIDASLISGCWSHPSGVTKFSDLTDQITTEGGAALGRPNMRTWGHAHEHLVSFLQLQEHCVSSVISCVSTAWPMIRGPHDEVAVLHQLQLRCMFSSSMIEEGEVINTCNRCNKHTCGDKRAFVSLWVFLKNINGKKYLFLLP